MIGISIIPREIYFPLLWEDSEAFVLKLRLFPQGCFAYLDENIIVGYAFGHPWTSDRIVALGEYITLPEKPDIYYIHDVAVNPKYRAKGIGRALVEKELTLAKELGFEKTMLVSVLNSEMFWEKFGFKEVSKIAYAKNVPGTIMQRG